jgi:hypothetical protein
LNQIKGLSRQILLLQHGHSNSGFKEKVNFLHSNILIISKLQTGPLSLEVGNSVATIPLPIFHPGFQSTIAKAQAQNAATYLPKTYTAENIAGYVAQRDILMKSFASLTNGLTG